MACRAPGPGFRGGLAFDACRISLLLETVVLGLLRSPLDLVELLAFGDGGRGRFFSSEALSFDALGLRAGTCAVFDSGVPSLALGRSLSGK